MTTDSTEATADTEAEGEDSNVVKTLRKQLAAAEAKAGELEGQLGTFTRDKAFDDAGVPKDGPAQFFRKAYDGDLTPEAIREAAVTGGILQQAQAGQAQVAQPTGPTPEELAAIARTAQATTMPSPQAPPDLSARIKEAGKDGAGDPQEVLRLLAEGGLPDGF